MGMESVVIDVEKLRLLGAGPDGGIFKFFVRIGMEIDKEAKQLLSNDMVNVRTGNLRSSQSPPVIHYDGGMLRMIIQNTAKYSAAVHNGSRPHEIEPVSKQYLTGWVYDGSPVFTKIVHHPGTKPRPFIKTAVERVMQRN